MLRVPYKHNSLYLLLVIRIQSGGWSSGVFDWECHTDCSRTKIRSGKRCAYQNVPEIRTFMRNRLKKICIFMHDWKIHVQENFWKRADQNSLHACQRSADLINPRSGYLLAGGRYSRVCVFNKCEQLSIVPTTAVATCRYLPGSTTAVKKHVGS